MPFVPLSTLIACAQGSIAGIDVGEQRIGLAVSDKAQRMAFPLAVIQRSASRTKDLITIARQIEERGSRALVWGWPLHLSGDMGIQCQKVDALAAVLAPMLSIPFLKWDERLSTVASTKLLQETVGSRKRQHLDSQSASFVLQGALDWLRAHR
jgi:putative Holliday junction resolvase